MKTSVCLPTRGAQILVFGFQAGELERILHRDQKFFRGQRLFQKIQRAQPRRPDRHLNMRLPAHHHHRRSDAGSLQVFQQRQPVAARHHHVAQNQIEWLRAGQLQRAYSVVADHGLVAR